MGPARPIVILLLVAAVLALGSAFAMGAFRGPPHAAAPSPQVRRLLPAVERCLAVSAGGGSWFCAVRYLGIAPAGNRVQLFVWEVCQEYRRSGDRLATLTGWSVPAVVTLARNRAGYRPLAESEPGDGDLYTADIQRMFPANLQAVISSMTAGVGVAPIDHALMARARRHLLRAQPAA
jgi:hypothetical protein